MSGYWTLEQGGASLPPAWLSGNSQFFQFFLVAKATQAFTATSNSVNE